MKSPKAKFEISETKLPKSAVPLVINKDQRVSWQTHLIDLDGAWGLSGISAHNFSIPDGTV